MFYRANTAFNFNSDAREINKKKCIVTLKDCVSLHEPISLGFLTLNLATFLIFLSLFIMD